MYTTPRMIRSEADYEEALHRYEQFFDSEPEVGTAEADEFELLGILLTRYEEQALPRAEAEPVELEP